MLSTRIARAVDGRGQRFRRRAGETQRRHGGQPLFLCTLCHNRCERILLQQAKPKKGILGFLQDTVRLKFGGRPKV